MKIENGSQVGVHRGPNRPFTVLNIKGSRAIVTDHLTKKKQLPLANLRPWSDITALFPRGRESLDFSSLNRRLLNDQEQTKKKSVLDIINNYLGSSASNDDFQIMYELYESGVPLAFAAYATPYTKDDIPHIYQRDSDVSSNGNKQPKAAQVEVGLTVGTEIPLDRIMEEERNTDQSPHVLVQWWNNRYLCVPPVETNERIEVEEINPDQYVQRTYKGSKAGEFDGELVHFWIYTEDKEDPFPQDVYPGRKMFKITGWSKQGSQWRELGPNIGGAVLLNGVDQLKNFPGPLHKIK